MSIFASWLTAAVAEDTPSPWVFTEEWGVIESCILYATLLAVCCFGTQDVLEEFNSAPAVMI
jgi:hypothetical protein